MEQTSFILIGADKLPEAMSTWEKSLHKETADLLVRLAMLKTFVEASGQRSAVLSFLSLLNIAEGHEVF